MTALLVSVILPLMAPVVVLTVWPDAATAANRKTKTNTETWLCSRLMRLLRIETPTEREEPARVRVKMIEFGTDTTPERIPTQSVFRRLAVRSGLRIGKLDNAFGVRRSAFTVRRFSGSRVLVLGRPGTENSRTREPENREPENSRTRVLENPRTPEPKHLERRTPNAERRTPNAERAPSPPRLVTRRVSPLEIGGSGAPRTRQRLDGVAVPRVHVHVL